MGKVDPDRLMEEYTCKKAEVEKLSHEHRHNIGVFKLESQKRVFDILADTLNTLRVTAIDLKERK